MPSYEDVFLLTWNVKGGQTDNNILISFKQNGQLEGHRISKGDKTKRNTMCIMVIKNK